jgi:hypothetical protein
MINFSKFYHFVYHYHFPSENKLIMLCYLNKNADKIKKSNIKNIITFYINCSKEIEKILNELLQNE